MSDNGCIGCNSAITQQKAEDEKVIQAATEKARKENITVGLFRDEQGRLNISTSAGNPIFRYISPFM